MPIYEYRCNSCQRRVDVFIRDLSKHSNTTCTHSGSQDLNRIYSRFAVRRGKSDLSVYDDILSDSQLTQGLMNNDPRALAKWSRHMSHAADEDPTPESEELLDRLDAGEDVSEMVEMMKPPELKGGD